MNRETSVEKKKDIVVLSGREAARACSADTSPVAKACW